MIQSLGRVLRRTLRPALVISVLLLLVAACASGGGPFAGAGPGGAAQPEARPATNDQSGGGTTGSQTGPGEPQPAQQSLADQTLIVKTGTLQMEVPDVSATVIKARTLVASFGGYVSGSQQSLEGDQPIASITYRVPAARWDEAINALKGLGGKVLGEKTDAVEVTGQVLDLGARIDNLRATEKALQAIMVKATKISDILEVQAQLTNVQGQIEQLSTEKAHLEAQAAYGTLTVGFQAPVAAVTTAAKGWNFGEQVDRALAQLVEIGQGLATLLVWFGIVILPFLLVGLLAFALLLALVRRIAPRRPAGPPIGPATDSGASTAA